MSHESNEPAAPAVDGVSHESNETAAPAVDRRSRIRAILAGALGSLAAVAVLVGGSGLWALSVAFDSDRFERRVDEVLGLPEVSDAIATWVVDEVAEAVDLRGAVIEVLPDAFEPAVDLLLAGARSFMIDRVADAVRRDEIRSVVAGAAGRAHAGAVEVIRGGSLVDGLRVVDDEVRIDLLPLVGLSIERLQELGLFGDFERPDLTREAGADENRASLEDALGRELPPDFGELVVYRSDSVERAGAIVDLVQLGVVVSSRVSVVALLVGAVAAVGSVLLSQRRIRAATLIASALVGEVLVVQFVTERAARRVPTLVETLGGQVAIADIVADLQRSLVRTIGLIVLAVVVLVVAVLAGPRLRTARRPVDPADPADPSEPTA